MGGLRATATAGAVWVRGLEGVRHVLPDFLIIGIRKGGTTSLHRYLRQHPLVRAPNRRKEARYFDAHWGHGRLWYRTFFPLAKEQRRHVAEVGRPFLSFESTPNYLYWPEVPERVARVLPDAKFVAVLRNPIDRAFSDYQSLVATGREHRTFDEVVRAELAEHESGRYRPVPHQKTQQGSMGHLLAFGLYADALERWWRHVDPARLLVLVSEDLFADEAATVRRVTDFLDLPPFPGHDFDARNLGGYEEGVDLATRERLRSFYAPHNERLYGLLGRDLGWR
jgi:hypothetical protein